MTDTLFDVGASPAPARNQAADATRHLPKCWDYCGHCSMKQHMSRSGPERYKLYKLCYHGRNPKKVYPDTAICDEALPRLPKPAWEPPVKGWEDY